jgi:hypothetical protein
MDFTTKQARLAVFTRHLARLDRRLDRLEAVDGRFFWLRLGALVAGAFLITLGYLATRRTGADAWVWAGVALFLAGFSVVVFFHRRLDRSVRRTRLSRRYWAAQAARMGLEWGGLSLPAVDREYTRTTEVVTTPDHAVVTTSVVTAHPFAGDLDLAGPRSLHHLLDTAASHGGSRRLLDWLLAPRPDLTAIHTRQAILKEIAPLNGFRSRLALNSALVERDAPSRSPARQGEPAVAWDGDFLLDWLQAHPPGRPLARLLWLLFPLAALNTVLFLLNFIAGLPPYWVLTFTLYAAVHYYRRQELGETFEDAQAIATSLEKFRLALEYLEHYPYASGSRLKRLCAPFWEGPDRPSQMIRRLVGIASAASLRGNPFVWLILNLVTPWDLLFAHLLNQARQALQTRLPAWLESLYELEALNSLANYAYLNPSSAYPAVLEPGSEPVFSAAGLGHPLIPDAEKVRNDFNFPRLGQIALITGSNMSGKSTFLRTLGINLALAYAGGPVDAAALQTLPFRLYTCINVSDSLADGISYFYAEVRRLKGLLDALHASDPLPLFFLIDEIFRGTNNRERQIGSRAYVRALAGQHGVGAISTHDLELVNLAGELPEVANYHFREEVQDGRLAFDYLLRPGPSPTTNALKIMAMEGLPVEGTDDDGLKTVADDRNQSTPHQPL